MEVPEEVIYNFLSDLRKKEINPVERAKIINAYMEDKKLSLRELSAEIGIPHTTIKGWLDYKRLDNGVYEKMLATDGKTGIHDLLKRGQITNSGEVRGSNNNKLNTELKKAISGFRGYIQTPQYDKNTIDLLKELKNVCSRIEISIDKKMRGR